MPETKQEGVEFDFAVPGIPVSAQTRNNEAKQRWKDTVRGIAEANWPDPSLVLIEDVSVLIIFFYEGETDLDLDNIAKPILDALVNVVYHDDQQVAQLTLRKTNLAEVSELNNPSPNLLDAMYTGGNFVYVRIGGPPDHGEMP